MRSGQRLDLVCVNSGIDVIRARVPPGGPTVAPGLYDEIRIAGPRPAWEMEQVLPEDAVSLRWEEDPILEAVALSEAGYLDEATSLLGDLLIRPRTEYVPQADPVCATM